MTIQAIIFDFDGLILDTETPEFESWKEQFEAAGTTLSLKEWADCIGRASHFFDPIKLLEEKTATKQNAEKLKKTLKKKTIQKIAQTPILPGVIERIHEARQMNLGLAVASSSEFEWVEFHLTQRNLKHYFESVICRDHVENAKPSPDLFLKACRTIGVAPQNALAFEDSPNGVRAAKAAGMICVAVPNRLTAQLDLSHADIVLQSLAQTNMTELLGGFSTRD